MSTADEASDAVPLRQDPPLVSLWLGWRAGCHNSGLNFRAACVGRAFTVGFKSAIPRRGLPRPV